MTTTTEATPPPASFDSLPLTPEVRRALDEMGFSSPTPVQLAVYQPAVEGKDLIVQARTGTGKTAAFGIPMADRLVKQDGGVQALILAPTRELALQSSHEIQRVGKYRSIRVTAVYGGAPMERQVAELASGAQIVSGTPGRVLDHLRRGTLDAKRLKVLVLDEADEMLSMGFARELHSIMEMLPKEKQVLYFSATVDDEVQRMAKRHMRDPQFVALSSDAVGAQGITHYVYMVTGPTRTRDLVRILEVEDPESAVIFCNQKAETERVSAELNQAGFAADWLNGDLPQSERESVMGRTKSGKLRYLVATDVAARGIDISHLTHVINYSFPESVENYVHRVGRTGRAGRTGTAISLIGPKEIGNLYYLRLQFKIFPIERSLPSEGEMRTRQEADRIQLLADAFPGEPNETERAVARRLLSHPDAERLLAGLLGTFFGTRGAAAEVDEEAAAARRGRVVTSAPVATKPAHGAGRASAAAQRSAVPHAPAHAVLQTQDTTAIDEDVEPTRMLRRKRTRGADEAAPQKRESTRREPREARAPREGSVTREPRDHANAAAALEALDPEEMAKTTTFPAFREGSREPADEMVSEEGMSTLYVSLGRRDGVRPGEVVRLIRERVAGLGRDDIGRVRIRDRHSFVGIRTERLDEVVRLLHGQPHGDRNLVVELAKPPRQQGL